MTILSRTIKITINCLLIVIVKEVSVKKTNMSKHQNLNYQILNYIIPRNIQNINILLKNTNSQIIIFPNVIYFLILSGKYISFGDEH